MPAALTERITRRRDVGAPPTSPPAPAATLAPMPLAEMEKQLILSVLAHTGGNRTRAAEILGISREGLRTKMQRMRISEA